ncbi:MAG: SLC13/DASS family transporter [Gammaproteobacteria bacterium]|nr:MAG: SLC13/DASS family transporter [Gammaproteobacteria bacterium]UTW42644.1 SLC13/DASS family transporter [bacterium SCSIO 12844]
MYLFQVVITIITLLIVLSAFISRRFSPYPIVICAAILLFISQTLSLHDVKHVALNSGPITIICLFIITSALRKTGLIYQIGRWILKLNDYNQYLTWICAFACVLILSAFINNTPIVLVMAPVIAKIARANRKKPAKFLIPLSYVSILGGMCTLIGTSTNIITNDVATSLGLQSFNIFEITIPGMIAAAIGTIYLLLVGTRYIPNTRIIDGKDLKLYSVKFHPKKASIALIVLALIVLLATFNLFNIASLAIIGAIVVLACQCIGIKEALKAVEWKLILLIYAMLALSVSANNLGIIHYLVHHAFSMIEIDNPIILFMFIYIITTLLTEILTNNAVAILITPIVIQISLSLGFEPTPFIAAVMFGASASFSTPMGYQTNTYIYTLGNYHLFDFVKVGLPLDFIVFVSLTIVAYFYWF